MKTYSTLVACLFLMTSYHSLAKNLQSIVKSNHPYHSFFAKKSNFKYTSENDLFISNKRFEERITTLTFDEELPELNQLLAQFIKQQSKIISEVGGFGITCNLGYYKKGEYYSYEKSLSQYACWLDDNPKVTVAVYGLSFNTESSVGLLHVTINHQASPKTLTVRAQEFQREVLDCTDKTIHLTSN